MKIGYKIFSGFLFILFFVLLSFIYILFLSFNKIEEKTVNDLVKAKKAAEENIRDFLNLKQKEAMQVSFDSSLENIFKREKKAEQLLILRVSEDIKTKIYGGEKFDRNVILAFLDKNFDVIGANYGSYNWKDFEIFEEIKEYVLKKSVINDNGIAYYSVYNGYISSVCVFPYNYKKSGDYDGIIVLITPMYSEYVDKLKRITGLDVFLYSNDYTKAASTLYEEGDENTIFSRIKSNVIKLGDIKLSKKFNIENEEIGKVIINEKEYYIEKFDIISYYMTKKTSGINNSIGKVALLKNMDEMKIEREKFIFHILEFLIFQISIAVLISFFISSIIVRPIKELNKYIEKISENEFNFDIYKSFLARSDEIGSLSKSFNKMKNEINSNHKKIKYYNNELEKSYKETKNYLYILELKNKEMEERLKERGLIKDILSKGISEIADLTNFLTFLLKRLNEYKPYKRAEIIYKNGMDETYERIIYVPEKDKIIENSYNENLKYLITDRPIIKDEYIEMPIKTRNGVVGNIKIEAESLDRNTERIMDIIVSELQIILENTEFYYKLNKRVMELSFLNSILVSISSASNITEMKKMVKDAVSVLFNTQYSKLYIYEDGFLVDFYEEEDELVKEKYLKINNIKTYLLNKYTPLKMNKDYNIPLVVKDTLVGAIEVSNVEKFSSIDKNITKVFLVQLSIIIKNKVIDLENKKKSFGIIRSLAEAIEAKDNYTRGHSERVMKYGVKIAEKLSMEQEDIDKIKYAGVLHDVGKIGIPENILQKNGGLSDEEYAIIKTHPEKGAKILSHMSSLNEINEIVKYHHERIDGKGYPEGLKGEEIPLGAKILAIADTFDAMTSDRPYRKGLPLEIVKIEIENNKGKQFDEKIADLVIDMINKGELEIEKDELP